MPAGLDGNPEPITTAERDAVIAVVVRRIESRRRPPALLLVAIDGIDGAGKSTFADEVGRALAARDVPVIRSTIDSFHQPRARRWARGKLSPEGFYLDSHDLPAVQAAAVRAAAAVPRRGVRRAVGQAGRRAG